ncbi:hypothetical protein PR048_032045 [Dryococelus australis]|uniref:Uncharacterized protein n=1 Tax=Dryococelus australis TaxID=614101 RepID=A0ABQ9G700_9NEOP|nr:hypothetical protein PR048_032045 [Dryococelus australis]
MKGGRRNHVLNGLPNTVRYLVLYYDSCVDQNNHFTAITYVMSTIHNDHFDTIWHNFFVSEHTYMPCDRDSGAEK